jgi:ElaB/YqjD/DUF883 family membrane-anchored ribosome-binding protein
LAQKEDIMANTTDTLRENVGNAADKAKDAAAHVVDKAKDVTRQAEDVAKNVGRRADDVTAHVGSGIRSAGETVRSKGPQEGVLGSATSATAGALESTGRYLEEEKLSGMAEDMTNVIRRNPITALLVAAGIGFLIGRALRS